MHLLSNGDVPEVEGLFVMFEFWRIIHTSSSSSSDSKSASSHKGTCQ